MQHDLTRTASTVAVSRLPLAPFAEGRDTRTPDDDAPWADTVIDQDGLRHVYRETD